ncbi:MAG: RNA polymerase sigma factor [Coprobacillaceae bacterium]
MDKKEELTQIVRTVQRGKGQFELLYSHVINKVYYWCYSIVNDETLAKDLAQECMIKIYQKFDTLKNAETFSSWMYILVRNFCYDFVRSSKRKNSQFLESNDFSEDFENVIEEERIDNLPDEAYNLKEVKQIVTSCVENLTSKQREVIILFYLEEFTTLEISKILDCKVGTVKTNLHYGRRKLEKQLTDYQDENNIKLYSGILLPLLGLILQERQDEMGDKQNLSYDEEIYKTNSLSTLTKRINVISTNMLSVISITVVVSIIAIIVLVTQVINNNTISNNGSTTYQSSIDDLEMLKKVESNPYIESITYGTFPSRNSTPVLINLKRDITEQNIQVLFDREKIEFNKNEREISILATQNGEYSIIINNQKLSFNVNSIDEYAPEIVRIHNYGNYLQLIVNDEMSQINYEKSYVEYKGKQYEITSNNQVAGNFSGDIIVYVYNNLAHYRYYEFYIE